MTGLSSMAPQGVVLHLSVCAQPMEGPAPVGPARETAGA